MFQSDLDDVLTLNDKQLETLKTISNSSVKDVSVVPETHSQAAVNVVV